VGVGEVGGGGGRWGKVRGKVGKDLVGGVEGEGGGGGGREILGVWAWGGGGGGRVGVRGGGGVQGGG